MNDKAELRIAVKAIMLVIIAVVTLSLILPFLLSSWEDTEREFRESTVVEQEPPTPTVGKPLTISSELKLSSPNDVFALKIGVRNNGPEQEFLPIINCNNDALTDTQVLAQTIPTGDAATFMIIASVSENATKTTHLCTVEVSDIGRTAFRLELE